MTLVLLFIITLMAYLFLVKMVTLGEKIQKKVVTTMWYQLLLKVITLTLIDDLARLGHIFIYLKVSP